ncbi:hypothetical protein [Fodinibius sp.]|uniref:hypothetical protein n=1 Tax=Fodinibius sp. TaxID=1872440 RepID=UPI0035659313
MIDKRVILRYLSKSGIRAGKSMVEQRHKARRQNEYLIDQYRKIMEILEISESDLEVIFDAREGWSELQEYLLEQDSPMNNKTFNGVHSNEFPGYIKLFLS